MASGLRKCLDMVAVAHDGDPGDLTVGTTLDRAVETGTKWVRVWLLWDHAQPVSSTTYDWDYIGLIDRQIWNAAVRGLKVMLVTTKFPGWVNGTAGAGDDYRFADRDLDGAPGGDKKELAYGIPTTQLGTDQAWGTWLNFVMSRYRGYNTGPTLGSWNVVLEIMNEPNYELWPQMNDSNQTIIWNKVAEMMRTAASVSIWNGGFPIAGPATADFRGSTGRIRTNYFDFVTNLVSTLRGFNFFGTTNFLWTHHNYNDIRQDSIGGTRNVRNAITGFWRGWATNGISDGNNPGIWITEGGSHPGEVGLQLQAARIQSGWDKARAEPGVSMFTNYGLYATSHFDTALREALPGGATRPAWTTFKNLPGNR